MQGQTSARSRTRGGVPVTGDPWASPAELAPSVQRTREDPHTPSDSPVLALLRRMLEHHRLNTVGEVAAYIPELGRADPGAFGIAVATVDGAVYEVGDTRTPFTIQSMSKPLTYAAVLDLYGEPAVRQRIGVEPTGEAFNAITLETGAGIPHNPMVNAGAIAAVGLMPEDVSGGRVARIAEACGRFVGRPMTVDPSVYASERDTGHRNRAIAHLLRSTGALDDDPDGVVDAYFQQCALAVDARDLALIAATLANDGVHPLTGERAASVAANRATLSVMLTCGMYDGAGRWLFEVGLPAKSGVSGGIFAVLPGRMGVGVWSPPLDAQGNSVRGVAVCRELVERLDLHLMRGGRPAGPVRARTTVAASPSKRRRSTIECERLRAEAGRSLVLELHGDVGFVALERVARVALGDLTRSGEAVRPSPAAIVVDLRRVGRIEPAVIRSLADLVAAAGGRGAAFAWSSTADHHAALLAIDAELRALGLTAPVRFADLDLALEWAEDVVLSRTSADVGGPGARANGGLPHVPLADHPMMTTLPAGAAASLMAVMERRTWAAGEQIVRRGDSADSLLVITGGRLSVRIPIGPEASRRLTTLEAGMLVGELAFLGGERRTADVEADTPVEAWVLRTEAFAALAAADPATASAFLEVLLRIVAGIARRLTSEVAALAS